MTVDKESGIGGLARGPIPSASHDTCCHRCEGIGRRFLARENRKNKKEDEPKNSDWSSNDGNPFKRDRTRSRPHLTRVPESIRVGGVCLWGDRLHGGQWVRRLKFVPT
jgi:hypothetical protein